MGTGLGRGVGREKFKWSLTGLRGRCSAAPGGRRADGPAVHASASRAGVSFTYSKIELGRVSCRADGATSSRVTIGRLRVRGRRFWGIVKLVAARPVGRRAWAWRSAWVRDLWSRGGPIGGRCPWSGPVVEAPTELTHRLAWQMQGRDGLPRESGVRRRRRLGVGPRSSPFGVAEGTFGTAATRLADR